MKIVTARAVLEIINKCIENDAIVQEQLNDNLSEFGVDSIKFIQIIVELEEAFECEIPDSKLLMSKMDTVQKIYDVLQELYESQLL